MPAESKNTSLTINIDTEGLSESQIRLLRSINSMLTHVLTTNDECDYFDGSSELFHLVANIVKQANFGSNSEIEYTHQALEFSIENLNDCLSKNTVIRYDN